MTYEEVQAASYFTNQMVMVRDLLDPIVSGQIKRGHCVGGRECYGATPGMRKTTLKDAVRIAKHCQFIINREVNKFDRME